MSPVPDDGFTIRHAATRSEVARCFPLMHLLRPQLGSEAELVDRHRRQADAGYRLLARWQGDSPLALAGYRVSENLVHGRHLYVDDLITHPTSRNHGHGKALLMHLQSEARAQGCGRLVLDSAVGNTDAHRFYQKSGLMPLALHFIVNLP